MLLDNKNIGGGFLNLCVFVHKDDCFGQVARLILTLKNKKASSLFAFFCVNKI